MKYFLLLILVFSVGFSLDMDLLAVMGRIKAKDNPNTSLIEQKTLQSLNSLEETFSNYKLKVNLEANCLQSIISGNSLNEQKTQQINGQLKATKIQPLILGANGQIEYSLYQDKIRADNLDTYSLSQELLMQYSQPLTLGGAVKNHYDLLLYPLQRKRVLLNALDEVNQYYYDILSMYIGLLRTQAELSISSENIRNMETCTAISLQKYNQGNLSRMEFAKTKIELSKLKLDHEKRVMTKQMNERYFLNKLGMDQAPTVNILFNALPKIPAELATVNSVILIQLKKLELEKIAYDIESIYGNEAPELNISGQLKRYNDSTDYNESQNYAKTVWTIVGSFKYPFFDEGSTQTKAQNLMDQKTILLQELAISDVFYNTKIRDLLCHLELLQKQISLYVDNKNLSNDILKVDQKRYVDGALSYYEMLQSLQNYNSIETQYIDTLYDLEQTKIDLLQTIGKLANL